jgi:hypothetical protein
MQIYNQIYNHYVIIVLIVLLKLPLSDDEGISDGQGSAGSAVALWLLPASLASSVFGTYVDVPAYVLNV